ncbi:MAG: 4-hydroxy-tetrahydrodipicolinate reductase [Saprospiraceae bacterium]
MKICLIGYGKMGKAIEIQSINRGHEIVSIIGRSNQLQLSDFLHHCDVAIEFTQPESALDNILSCFEHNTPIICGTTGWTQQWDEMLHFQEKTEGSLIWASNFSIGVNILFEINQHLAKIMSNFPEYKASIEEVHHIHKKDAPSGTGLSLAKQMLSSLKQYDHWKLSTEPSDDSSLIIDAIRREEVIGTHSVKYQSSIDEIAISHNAYNREGFALGAVIAAEWIQGKRGIFSMKDVLGFKQS